MNSSDYQWGCDADGWFCFNGDLLVTCASAAVFLFWSSLDMVLVFTETCKWIVGNFHFSIYDSYMLHILAWSSLPLPLFFSHCFEFSRKWKENILFKLHYFVIIYSVVTAYLKRSRSNPDGVWQIEWSIQPAELGLRPCTIWWQFSSIPEFWNQYFNSFCFWCFSFQLYLCYLGDL